MENRGTRKFSENFKDNIFKKTSSIVGYKYISLDVRKKVEFILNKKPILLEHESYSQYVKRRDRVNKLVNKTCQ